MVLEATPTRLQRGGLAGGLLLFGGKIILGPFFPSAFEGVNFLESQRNEFACHPGTGSLAGSGAVKDEGLVLGIFLCP